MNELKDINNQKDSITYLIKRWEKISIAVYMVSSFIKDMDNIKWDMRNRSLSILSSLHQVSEDAIERHVMLDECLKELNILTSELQLAFSAALIGRMNFVLIFEEIELYKREVFDYKIKDAVLSPLQKDFMRVEKDFPESIGPTEDKGHFLYKGHESIKDKIKDSQSAKAPQKVQPEKPIQENRIERRKAIINLIKNKDQVSIKDISTAMKDCSEKTIQRELLSLVAEGVLNKKGDRRWSTYSLRQKP